MKPRNHPTLTALLAILAGALHLHGQGTAFTYQGRLNAGGKGLSPSGGAAVFFQLLRIGVYLGSSVVSTALFNFRL